MPVPDPYVPPSDDRPNPEEFAAFDEALASLRPNLDRHDYLSTSCFHGRHDYCQATSGAAGPKVPGCCKFCRAACLCPCHRDAQPGGER